MRMPLFFFMSGYCFKMQYLSDSRSYLRKRIKGVYWPYAKWTIVLVLLHNVFFSIGIYNDTFEYNGQVMHEYSAQEMLLGLLNGIFMRGTERLLGGFWFLKSLFYGSIIFFVTRKFIPKPWQGATLLLSITIFSSYHHLRVPFLAINSRDCFAAFFIMTGHLSRNTIIRGNPLVGTLFAKKGIIAMFAVCIGLGSILWPTSMLHYQWHQVIPYAITAIMGTFVIFYIGHCLNNDGSQHVKSFLIYTGDHTFNVLTWHFLSFKLVSILLIALYSGIQYERLADFPVIKELAEQGWWVMYLIFGVMTPLAVCKILSLIKKRCAHWQS